MFLNASTVSSTGENSLCIWKIAYGIYHVVYLSCMGTKGNLWVPYRDCIQLDIFTVFKIFIFASCFWFVNAHFIASIIVINSSKKIYAYNLNLIISMFFRTPLQSFILGWELEFQVVTQPIGNCTHCYRLVCRSVQINCQNLELFIRHSEHKIIHTYRFCV